MKMEPTEDVLLNALVIAKTIHDQEEVCQSAVDERTKELDTLYSLVTFYTSEESALSEHDTIEVIASLMQTTYSLGFLDAKRKFAV